MSIPPLDAVTRVVAALRARGVAPALGGSGLLVALGLTETARDWDLTVDAPEHVVRAALRDTGLSFRDGTARGGRYATECRFVIDGGDHSVDLLVGFALYGPSGIETLPTRITGHWNGLPLADPAVWARAYRLLDRPAKARALERWLATRPG